MSTAKKFENKNILVNQESEIFFSGRKNLIQRCLNNLLNNAINFSKNIKVTQQKVKRSVLIFVEDDGPGIPSTEYENVFKPFYKVDKSRNQTKSSVGLGLSITSDIIRSHGGNIELGKSEMGGLKIKIVLPV
jgi:two-component system osmolarity sensor histidine kinase EnvZ